MTTPQPQTEEIALDMEDAPPKNEKPVGEILRAARVEQKMSIDQVANTLCIRSIYIEALEQSDYSRLPGLVYAKGFVRSYADYLKLDSETLVRQFKIENEGHDKSKELVFLAPVNDNLIPNKYVIGGSVALCFLVLLLWSSMSSDDTATLPDPATQTEQAAASESLTPPADTAETAPEATSVPTSDNSGKTLQEAVLNKPAPAADAKPVEEPKPAIAEQPAQAAPAIPQTGYVIVAKDDTWLEVNDKHGNAVFSRVLRAGETFTVPEHETATLSTGNAGGIRAYLNGAEQKSFGEARQIRRNMPLNGERPLPKPVSDVYRSKPQPQVVEDKVERTERPAAEPRRKPAASSNDDR